MTQQLAAHDAESSRLVCQLKEEKQGLERALDETWATATQQLAARDAEASRLKEEKRGLERFVHALAAVIKALVAAQLFHALDSWRFVHLEEGKQGLERAIHALAAVVAVLVAERLFFA